VLIAGLPAARVGDLCTCVGPPDSIVKGSPTVLLAGMMAARMGDNTAHGGVITAGCPTVLIGESGGGGGAGGGAAVAADSMGRSVNREAQRAVLQSAARSGAPFCEACERARRAQMPPPVDPRPDLLRRAAVSGTPFCEKCEAARREAEPPPVAANASQRTALEQASREGTPFCEACEEARG